MPTPIEILWFTREAGNVIRNHNWQTIRNQTDGHHSYNAAMIYMIMNPDPKMDVLFELLVHDLGERGAGDLPAPARWSDPVLAERYEDLEEKVRSNFGLGGYDDWSTEDMLWIKTCDALEFAMYCLEERHLGNRYSETKLDAVVESLLARYDAIPSQLKPLVQHIINGTIITHRDKDIIG